VTIAVSCARTNEQSRIEWSQFLERRYKIYDRWAQHAERRLLPRPETPSGAAAAAAGRARTTRSTAKWVARGVENVGSALGAGLHACSGH
jgi:hypothetical protein